MSSWEQKRKSHREKAEDFIEAEMTITHVLCSHLYFLGELGGVVLQPEKSGKDSEGKKIGQESQALAST